MLRRLTVLNVAYSLAPVGPGAIGGAEQVLTSVDEALSRAGHRSIVVAMDGSQVHGVLQPTPSRDLEAPIDDTAREDAWAAQRRAIAAALARYPVDLIHMHGVDFHAYLPAADVPVLATLHLPVDWYPPTALAPTRPRTFVHCVSESQRRRAPAHARLLPTIENGVRVERFALAARKRSFALALGRICPEKGYHLALDAARRAHTPLLLAGRVFGYASHRRYFDEEIAPRLGGGRRFIGPAAFARKRRLLAEARCLLVPSLAPETSSLVAMEALASGTPVVAFDTGALGEIVTHGVTGFLVRGEHEMADAITAAAELDPRACRAEAERRFSAGRMADRYLARYAELAGTVAGSLSDN